MGKAVIFDLDGTLLNTLDDLEDSVNHTLNYFKYPKRTKAEVRSFIGGGAKALIKKSLPENVTAEKYEEVLSYFQAVSYTHLDVYKRQEVCPFLARYSMTDWAACSSQVVTEERLSKSKSLLLLVNKRQGMWMWAKSSLKYSKLPPKKTIRCV